MTKDKGDTGTVENEMIQLIWAHENGANDAKYADLHSYCLWRFSGSLVGCSV